MVPTLQVREFPAKTLRWWYDERDNIDFNPPYQRKGEIWTPSNKQYLIDTILNGFDIPKFYIADFTFRDSTLNVKKKSFAVVDGRQRFEAIFDFFEDRIRLSRDIMLYHDPEIKIAGLTYSQLSKNHPRIARIFDNYSISVMSVLTNEEALINELFVRLNSSKPLTGAERRSAMTGEVSDAVHGIASHRFFTESVSFPAQRKQDENAAAKLLLIEFRGRLVDTKKRNLDALVKEVDANPSMNVDSSALPSGDGNELPLPLVNGNEPEESGEDTLTSDEIADDVVRAESVSIDGARERVVQNLDRMVSVFELKDSLLKSEGIIPVYYWFIRNSEDGHRQDLRLFLSTFQNTRLEFRKQDITGNNLRIQSPIWAAFYADFEGSLRNINDGSSLNALYQSLVFAFGRYMQDRDTGLTVDSEAL